MSSRRCAVEQHGHQVGGRHRRRGMARAGRRAGRGRSPRAAAGRARARRSASLMPPPARRAWPRRRRTAAGRTWRTSPRPRARASPRRRRSRCPPRRTRRACARAPSTSRSSVSRDLAVVLEGLDRLARHRVDRVGADELLDVDARRGTRGSWSTWRPTGSAAAMAPLAAQRLPLLAGEHLLVGLVGELGVGDRQRALELVVAADARRGACRPRCRRARRRTRRRRPSSTRSPPGVGEALRRRGCRPRPPRGGARARRSA